MTLLDTARRIAGLAEEEARRIGLAVTVCVVDRHGNVVLKQRMDGALLVSIDMSERKAFTAAALDMETVAITPLAQPGKDLYPLLAAAGGRYVALGGGVPLREGSTLHGGVGVSGGSSEQDVAVVNAAIAAFHACRA